MMGMLNDAKIEASGCQPGCGASGLQQSRVPWRCQRRCFGAPSQSKAETVGNEDALAGLLRKPFGKTTCSSVQLFHHDYGRRRLNLRKLWLAAITFLAGGCRKQMTILF